MSVCGTQTKPRSDVRGRSEMVSEVPRCQTVKTAVHNTSPGPNGLHPRILFETRNVISIHLRIIFEASTRMKQLAKDWINANICAVHKKQVRFVRLSTYKFN